MQEALSCIQSINPQVNAIVALRDSDALLAEARAADAVAPPDRGPLHGLPLAVKDLVDVKGMINSKGSPLFADHRPMQDDLVAARMREAGAIFIGKTNVPEFGVGSHTYNPVHGATLNPYDPSRSCGGSSGGAAVALATGMVALADGSDAMGSLRNPAAWNNVYGMRPSWGLIGPQPAGWSFGGLMSTDGPMARSPEDLSLLLDVLAGRRPTGLKPQSAALRIGWLGDWGGAFPTDPEILSLGRAALEVFENQGHQVDDLPPPFDAEMMWQAYTDLRAWQKLPEFLPLDRDHLKPAVQWELDHGLQQSGTHLHKMSEARLAWFDAAMALFDRYDALVLPTTQVWPFAAEIDYPREVQGHAMDTYHRWMQNMVPVSLLGLPAVAMPAGFGIAGLPTGLQIFGPRGADAQLLALAQAYHQATDWPGQRPGRV